MPTNFMLSTVIFSNICLIFRGFQKDSIIKITCLRLRYKPVPGTVSSESRRYWVSFHWDVCRSQSMPLRCLAFPASPNKTIADRLIPASTDFCQPQASGRNQHLFLFFSEIIVTCFHTDIGLVRPAARRVCSSSIDLTMCFADNIAAHMRSDGNVR